MRKATGTCEPTRATWDEHWDAIKPASSLFGRIASLVRMRVISRAVAYYASRYLAGDGPLVETGCGTGQSSWRIDVAGRPRIALDYASGALREARAAGLFDAFLQGDITRLPLRDASIAGLWNLGVLEHFDEAAGIRILREFRRVLAPGAHAVIFWPPEFGSSRMVEERRIDFSFRDLFIHVVVVARRPS